MASFSNDADNKTWNLQSGKAIVLRGRVSENGALMLASIIFVVMIGIILGSNFTVFILAPAILLTAAATLAAGFANDADFGVIVFAMLAMLASLQVGYFAGGIAAACQCKAPGSTWKSSRYY